MRLLYTFLCLEAVIDTRNNLNAFGIFSRSEAAVANGPVTFSSPTTAMVAVWATDPSDSHREREIELAVCDPDGKAIEIATLRIRFTEGVRPGIVSREISIMPLAGLTLPGPGRYTFKLSEGAFFHGETELEIANGPLA